MAEFTKPITNWPTRDSVDEITSPLYPQAPDEHPDPSVGAEEWVRTMTPRSIDE